MDPETNRVVAEIPIEADSPDGGAQGVAVGEGATWVTSVGGKLFKVDPRTVQAVGDEDLGPVGLSGTGRLAGGGGHVWALGAGVGTQEESSLMRISPGP